MISRDVAIKHGSPGFLDHDYVWEYSFGLSEGVDNSRDFLRAMATAIDIVGYDNLLARSQP